VPFFLFFGLLCNGLWQNDSGHHGMARYSRNK